MIPPRNRSSNGTVSPGDFFVAVKDARQSLGMSQEDLSRQTGIPRPWISRLEQGRINSPGLDRCLVLCSTLNISLYATYTVKAPISLQQYSALLHKLGYLPTDTAIPDNTPESRTHPAQTSQAEASFEATVATLKKNEWMTSKAKPSISTAMPRYPRSETFRQLSVHSGITQYPSMMANNMSPVYSGGFLPGFGVYDRAEIPKR